MKTISIYAINPFPHYETLFDKLRNDYRVKVWYHVKSLESYSWKKISSEKNVTKGNINSFLKITRDFISADLSIISGWSNLTSIYLIILLFLIIKKFAIWMDVPETKNLNDIKSKVKKLFLKMASYIFITGKPGISFLINKYNILEDKIVDFPYLCNEVESDYINQINNERSIKILEGCKIRILIANRFIERKGYDIVLKTFKKLTQLKVLNNFEITILGDGELFEYYKAEFLKLSKDIVLKGWVEHEDYLKEMDYTDIFLHASRFEPYGIPVIDAMNRGKVVICSDGVMSGVDRIENEENGFLFYHKDDNRLLDILLSLYNNPEKLVCIGQKARVTALKYLSSYNINQIDKIFSLK